MGIWFSKKNIDSQENGITLVRIKELDWKQNKQAEIDKIYKYIIEYTKKEVKNDWNEKIYIGINI